MGGWVGGCWAVVNPVVRVMVRKGGGGGYSVLSFFLAKFRVRVRVMVRATGVV